MENLPKQLDWPFEVLQEATGRIQFRSPIEEFSKETIKTRQISEIKPALKYKQRSCELDEDAGPEKPRERYAEEGEIMNKRTKEGHSGDREGITRLLVCAEKCTAGNQEGRRRKATQITRQNRRKDKAALRNTRTEQLARKQSKLKWTRRWTWWMQTEETKVSNSMGPKHWKHNTVQVFLKPLLNRIGQKMFYFVTFSLSMNPKPGHVDLIFNYFFKSIFKSRIYLI